MMFRLTIIVICALCAQATKMRYDNFQVYEVKAKSEHDVLLLQSMEESDAMELDFWQEGGRDVPAHICVSPEQRQAFLETLTNLGLEYKIIVNNVQQQIDEVDEQLAQIPLSQRNIQNQYYTYEQNLDYLHDLRNKNNNDAIMSIINYGVSGNGQPLFYVKLSSERYSSPDPADSTKPVIWIEATTHAREWITNACALNLIQWLVETTGESEAIEMLENYDWFIVPIHNPDGYAFTQSVRLWRKTVTSGGCSTGSSGTGNGVDSNRNWGYQWQAGSSTCSSTYPGPTPFSDPVNSHMADIMAKTPPQYRKGFFSLHSYSQFIMTPYGYSTTAFVPNYTEQLRVANLAAQAITDNGGPAFRVGKPGEILYNARGIAQDYAYGALGFTYSFTYELHPASANPGFVLPPGLIYSSFLDFLESIKAIAKHMQ